MTRKIPLINTNKCIFCGACVGVCPRMALLLQEGRVSVEETRCITCHSCEKLCPVGAITIAPSQSSMKE